MFEGIARFDCVRLALSSSEVAPFICFYEITRDTFTYGITSSKDIFG